MKILIVSDTHHRDENYTRVLERAGKVDLVIHLGDVEGSEDFIRKSTPCPVEMVRGNNDFFSDLPSEKMLHIGQHQVFITHGHRYYIGMGSEMLKQEAVALGADIVMYGHTHKPVIDIDDDITAINPGSLSYPRQENHKPSYIVMEVDDGGEAKFTLHYL